MLSLLLFIVMILGFVAGYIVGCEKEKRQYTSFRQTLKDIRKTIANPEIDEETKQLILHEFELPTNFQ